MHTNKLVSSFKERLNELCNRSELNDTELAKKLDVSKQTLSAWKCGTRSPKTLTIEMIANRFGVAVEWLIGFDVSERQEEKPILEDELDNILAKRLTEIRPEFSALAEVIVQLSPQGVESLLEYAEFLLKRESAESSDSQ